MGIGKRAGGIAGSLENAPVRWPAISQKHERDNMKRRATCILWVDVNSSGGQNPQILAGPPGTTH